MLCFYAGGMRMRLAQVLSRGGLVLLLLAAATPASHAQTQVVVPNAYDGVTGTSTFLGPMANAQRTNYSSMSRN